MSETNHPGWKPEGFMREPLSPQDLRDVLNGIDSSVEDHLENYGEGIFTHPHEITGCMYGQLRKLSIAADESIYSGELDDFKERCRKTMMAILMAMASVEKLKELRGQE